MRVGDNIKADISFTGTTQGNLPQPLLRPDTFFFSITEGDKDFGVPFEYDPLQRQFYIDKQLLPLREGVKYKFRGIGDNQNKSEPSLVIPAAVRQDTVLFENITHQNNNNTFTTSLQCRIKLHKTETAPGFLYIVPTTGNNKVWTVTSFLQDHNAFKRLEHRPGLLVDYSRLNDDEMRFAITVTDTTAIDELKLEVSHVTAPFYQFNTYLSNLTTDPGQTTQIPAIAGFNIKTDKAVGTFSALHTSFRTYRIR